MEMVTINIKNDVADININKSAVSNNICDTDTDTDQGITSTTEPTRPKKNKIRINISSIAMALNRLNIAEESLETIMVTREPTSIGIADETMGVENGNLMEENNGYYYRNREKKLEYQKRYNKEQGDKIKNYNKEYYQKKREEILEKAKTKIICECGCEVQLFNMNSHKKTKKHLRALEARATATATATATVKSL